MARFLALWLILGLALPSPSFALREIQTKNSGMEEQELTQALLSRPAAGMEEWGRSKWARRVAALLVGAALFIGYASLPNPSNLSPKDSITATLRKEVAPGSALYFWDPGSATQEEMADYLPHLLKHLRRHNIRKLYVDIPLSDEEGAGGIERKVILDFKDFEKRAQHWKPFLSGLRREGIQVWLTYVASWWPNADREYDLLNPSERPTRKAVLDQERFNKDAAAAVRYDMDYALPVHTRFHVNMLRRVADSPTVRDSFDGVYVHLEPAWSMGWTRAAGPQVDQDYMRVYLKFLEQAHQVTTQARMPLMVNSWQSALPIPKTLYEGRIVPLLWQGRPLFNAVQERSDVVNVWLQWVDPTVTASDLNEILAQQNPAIPLEITLELADEERNPNARDFSADRLWGVVREVEARWEGRPFSVTLRGFRPGATAAPELPEEKKKAGTEQIWPGRIPPERVVALTRYTANLLARSLQLPGAMTPAILRAFISALGKDPNRRAAGEQLGIFLDEADYLFGQMPAILGIQEAENTDFPLRLTLVIALIEILFEHWQAGKFPLQENREYQVATLLGDLSLRNRSEVLGLASFQLTDISPETQREIASRLLDVLLAPPSAAGAELEIIFAQTRLGIRELTAELERYLPWGFDYYDGSDERENYLGGASALPFLKPWEGFPTLNSFILKTERTLFDVTIHRGDPDVPLDRTYAVIIGRPAAGTEEASDPWNNLRHAYMILKSLDSHWVHLRTSGAETPPLDRFIRNELKKMARSSTLSDWLTEPGLTPESFHRFLFDPSSPVTDWQKLRWAANLLGFFLSDPVQIFTIEELKTLSNSEMLERLSPHLSGSVYTPTIESSKALALIRLARREFLSFAAGAEQVKQEGKAKKRGDVMPLAERKRIEREIKRLGVTRRRLTELAGMSEGQILYFVEGKKDLQLGALSRLLRVLHPGSRLTTRGEIRDAMSEQGISQSKLAELSETDSGQLSRFLNDNGGRGIYAGPYSRVLKALKLPLLQKAISPEQEGTPQGGRVVLENVQPVLEQWVDKQKRTIETLALGRTEPFDLQPYYGEAPLALLAREAGYPKGLVFVVPPALLDAVVLPGRELTIFVEDKEDWRERVGASLKPGVDARLIRFEESDPSKADIIIAEKGAIPLLPHQIFIGVNSQTIRRVTPGLLEQLNQKGLLKAGSVVMLYSSPQGSVLIFA